MIYVRQEDPNGCLVACIAMVSGLTYGAAMDLVRPAFRDGLNSFVVDAVLGDLGFANLDRTMFDPKFNAKRDPWPVAPFAPVHVVHASMAGGFHGLVMLADGTIFDPWNRDRTSLSHADYREINRISGYWKVLP